MKTLKILTITGITLVAALLLVSTVSAMPWGFGGMMGGYGGGGMMGGYGYGYGYNTPYTTQPSTPIAPSTQYYQPVYPFQFGGGCMGRFGWNRGYSYATPYTNGAPLNITTAKTIAQNYVTALNNPDLTVKQIEE